MGHISKLVFCMFGTAGEQNRGISSRRCGATIHVRLDWISADDLLLLLSIEISPQAVRGNLREKRK